MRAYSFAKRNFKEIIRDPLSIIFAVLLPLFLLYIFQQFNIPNDMFKIENFTPGIIIFSYSFITLFTASLIARDRTTSLLSRLYASPMKSRDYILGYVLAILPIVIIQNTIFFVAAILLGLSLSTHVLLTLLVSIPISFLFIALGILIGSITTEKSSSGVSSIIIQLVAFTSGMYFPTDMTGDFFNKICNILPFSRSVDVIRGILNNNYENIFSSSIVLIGSILVVMFLAIFIFKKKMFADNK